MITLGFAAGYSDIATVDVAFPYPSAYLYVSGTSGDIVYQNSARENQFFPDAQAGMLLPIAASMIISSGTVNGIPRTTTATDIVYLSTGKGV